MTNKEKVMSIFGDMIKWIFEHKLASFVLFFGGSIVLKLLGFGKLGSTVMKLVGIVILLWLCFWIVIGAYALITFTNKCEWCNKERGFGDSCKNPKCEERELREEEVQAQINKIKLSEHRLSIKQEAEKRLYGKVKAKKKRVPLSKDLRDKVFRKFDNQCMICEQKQGLHIHHKDHDPKNNAMRNLLLLCGVCHKKIHMKVR